MKQAEILFSEATYNYIVTTTVTTNKLKLKMSWVTKWYKDQSTGQY